MIVGLASYYYHTLFGRDHRAGRSSVEPVANAQGEREIWIDEEALNKLNAMRGPGENYSDVILKLAVRERRS